MIWSRSDTVLWIMRRDRTKSVRYAKVREEFQNKKKRGRWSEFTRNVAGVRQHLRIGEREHEQPGGRGALGGGGDGRGGWGLYIGGDGLRIGKEIAKIKDVAGVTTAGVSARDFSARKTTVMWPASGAHLSARKEKEKLAGSGEREGWAVGRLWFWAKTVPVAAGSMSSGAKCRGLPPGSRNKTKVPALWMARAGGPLCIGAPTQGAVNHAAPGTSMALTLRGPAPGGALNAPSPVAAAIQAPHPAGSIDRVLREVEAVLGPLPPVVDDPGPQEVAPPATGVVATPRRLAAEMLGPFITPGS
jgi:hypothetical protein